MTTQGRVACWSVAELSLELRFAASPAVLFPRRLSGLLPKVTEPSPVPGVGLAHWYTDPDPLSEALLAVPLLYFP